MKTIKEFGLLVEAVLNAPNLTQTDHAQILGMSSSKISKLIKAGEAAGFLITKKQGNQKRVFQGRLFLNLFQ